MAISKSDIKRKVGGKFFAATFEKKDGSVRKICGRLGVSKHVTGTGHPNPDNIVVVYETNKRQYRKFDVERLLTLDCGNFHYSK